MKIKNAICAAALLAIVGTTGLSAQQAANILPQWTTVQRLSENAEIVVVARLARVENVQLSEAGPDAKQWPRRAEGKLQDGEENIRREAVLEVQQVLKGNPGSEVRFVSVRQLRLENYPAHLRADSAVWFLAPRPFDNRLVMLAEERGGFSAENVNGDFTGAVDFVRDVLAKQAGIDRMLDAIDFKGGRLSLDNAYEFSWQFEHYADKINEEQRQRIVSLAQASPVGSIERNELITAIGRYKPEGGLNALFSIMLNDNSWPTTSLGCWALEEIDRRAAIERLVDEWASATDNTSRQIMIVRALGLIRAKHDFDGEELRNKSLEIVGSVLKADADRGLLREGLIASRDLRTHQEHVDALKKLIDERHENGLSDDEVKGAIVALAAARMTIKTDTGVAEAVYARKYLEDLAEAEPVLEQVIKPALQFPWTILIVGADNRGH